MRLLIAPYARVRRLACCALRFEAAARATRAAIERLDR